MASDGLESVSAAEAIVLSTGGSILLDVRETWEWELGHSPAATNLPMSELERRVDELPLDTTVLVVCHSGARSASVSRWLQDAGYSAVNVDGGMLAWQAAGGEVVADGTQPPRV